MNVSGTLHFYSGDDRELFFVFDDDVAQDMYRSGEFDIDDLETRRVYISVGADRFIHRRTLNFSRKQTEIKVSLCSRATKEGLGALTAMYNWFSARGRPRPSPFPLLGKLVEGNREGRTVWELRITEPIGVVVPPGLPRRKKSGSLERRSFEHRRKIQKRDLAEIGRPAERLALALAQRDFASPPYECMWRDAFLDSARVEIRKMGIIADIDVWNCGTDRAERFIEVKSQKVRSRWSEPAFYLSLAEWRSVTSAKAKGIPYEVWLFQYREHADFGKSPEKLTLIVFDQILAEWLAPNVYLVTPGSGSGRRIAMDF